MNKTSYAVAVLGGYSSPESDKEATSSATSTEPETSPPTETERDSESCEPVSADTRRLGNRRRKPHSIEAWEAVKADIARLYLDENRRLKDVMEILEEKRGFRATQKMYKTKLTQWKFFKNNRQSDVANLLYLQQHRLAMGKESTFRRNGRTVDVSAYIRRKGLRPVDLLEAAQSGDLPPTLRCGTPPPPPSPPRLPKQIQAPDDFLLQEAYLFWSLDNPFVPPPLDRNFFRQLDIYHKSDAVRSVALLTHGCWLLSIGKIQEGGCFCRRAFASVDSVLRGAAHFAVYELMEVIRRYPDPGIHRALWNYLAAYAARTNGLNPNLKRVLAAIANLAGNSDMDHSLLMFQWARRIPSMQSNGTFDGKPFDYTFIQPWDMLPMDRSYNHRYYMNQGLWTVENIPTATMPNLEEVGDPWNLRADLLVVFGNQTAWADDRIPALALKMLDQVPEDRPHGYLHFVCLYALAQNNRARCRDGKAQFDCDHKLARNYLRQAADVQSQAWQPGKNYYETLTLLEAWHLEAGDKEEAEATRTKRDVECQKAFENLHL